jgi:GNAT superfamily N-acetyltransferase
MQKNQAITIREGVLADIQPVFRLVEELAVHHDVAPDHISNSAERMEKDAFGHRPAFSFFVAEEEGKVVGAAIYYYTYSTWKGKSLYLEDLIITGSHRGRGIGQLFMQALANEAVNNGAQKMKWQVAEDNEGAIRFYERSEADLDPNWINCELNQQQLSEMVEPEMILV